MTAAYDALRELVEALEPKLGTMNYYFGPGARSLVSRESEESYKRISAAVKAGKEVLDADA